MAMSLPSKRRAIFLDRDGVINVNRPDNVKQWDEFCFENGSLDALARLGASEYCLIVVSNQSGIGRGHMSAETVDMIHARMVQAIVQAGGRIDRIYYCPHAPAENCSCRKPSPEMLERGRTDLDLDLARSFFIGDWIDDVRAARNAGAVPLLVRTGRGAHALEEIHKTEMPLPQVFENLAAAVTWILENGA